MYELPKDKEELESVLDELIAKRLLRKAAFEMAGGGRIHHTGLSLVAFRLREQGMQ